MSAPDRTANSWRVAGHSVVYARQTLRMVSMNTLLELERQKKVVSGNALALTAWTPRIIAGCYIVDQGVNRLL